MRRRDFLRVVAGVPVAFGLGGCASFGRSPFEAGGWFAPSIDDVLAEASARGRWALVVVVPEHADRGLVSERYAIAENVERMLVVGDGPTRRLIASLVIIVATHAELASAVPHVEWDRDAETLLISPGADPIAPGDIESLGVSLAARRFLHPAADVLLIERLRERLPAPDEGDPDDIALPLGTRWGDVRSTSPCPLPAGFLCGMADTSGLGERYLEIVAGKSD